MRRRSILTPCLGLLLILSANVGVAGVGDVATDPKTLKVAKGFNVELLYSVPKDQQGSWVSMCVDAKGRLIVCDQYGGLYRATPPGINDATEFQLEKVPADIGEAHGLLWAFDSLYVVVNKGKKYETGLYRVRDTDGDDQLDDVELLRSLEGVGEHGPHAILLTPDKQSLYLVCGNRTAMTEIDESRVPRHWDEDVLLPRPYGRGFMKGTRAPGGYVVKIDPDAKHWELISTGYRNQFDAALNADGELFTYDADMEWDMNAPWYRPTRICQVVSGSEFGWRNGGGKWPAYYPDSWPAVVNIGPGSPTGVCFGYGAKFPAKYQHALFACDWSYGKLYAVHLTPQGSTYSAVAEEFITGAPLPLTDIIVHPHDGAMYFAIGGRKVQSGLYKVTYSGEEATDAVDAANMKGRKQRELRHKLETLHLGDHPDAVATAWPYLNHKDRFIRNAARIAIEHRPVDEWREQALAATDVDTALTALLALARTYERLDKGAGDDIDSVPPSWSDADSEVPADRQAAIDEITTATARFGWAELSARQKIGLLRVYEVAFLRVGRPSAETRQALIEQFTSAFPTSDSRIDSELAKLLVYLQAPKAAELVTEALMNSPTQEGQIDLAKSLRHLRTGWTDELQKQYFQWFVRAAGYRGGASFSLFVENIKKDAVSGLSPERVAELKPILDAKPKRSIVEGLDEERELVKNWTMEELAPLVENGLHGRDFAKGRRMFAAARCFACHRFDQQGGAIGPDLTALSGRFSKKDLLESIVEPNKVISDQYAAVTILTVDGKVVTGRIVNLAGDTWRVNTNMLNPDAMETVKVDDIEEVVPSKTSMMPMGLMNTLNQEEILDLMAYLLSRGDPKHEMFQDEAATK